MDEVTLNMRTMCSCKCHALHWVCAGLLEQTLENIDKHRKKPNLRQIIPARKNPQGTAVPRQARLGTEQGGLCGWPPTFQNRLTSPSGLQAQIPKMDRNNPQTIR